jgi:hypothetical protein
MGDATAGDSVVRVVDVDAVLDDARLRGPPLLVAVCAAVVLRS